MFRTSGQAKSVFKHSVWFFIIVVLGYASLSYGLDAKKQSPTKAANLSGSWTYGNGGGIAIIKQTGSNIEIEATWTQYMNNVAPHYRISGTLTGNTIDGRWICVNKHTEGAPCEAGEGWKFHAEVSPDLKTINILNTEDPKSHHWNGLAIGTTDAKSRFTVTESAGKTKVVMNDDILFDFNKSELKPAAARALETIKSSLIDRKPGGIILVEGHTDDKGDQKYNLELSTARAKSVETWLIQSGVGKTRIRTKGYGKTKPRVPPTSDENRAKNRRVEITISG